jgi:hypothetical protein
MAWCGGSLDLHGLLVACAFKGADLKWHESDFLLIKLDSRPPLNYLFLV